MTGICAEIRVDGPAVCQLADASGTVSSVSRGTRADDEGTVTEEFTVSDDEQWAEEFEAEPIFSYDDRTVYRFSRAADQDCVCELVEQTGCTVRGIQVVDGSVVLTFLTTDLTTVRDVIADLRDTHEGVRIRRLTRSDDDQGDDSTIVDLNVLTARQREVLDTAYEMGYFEYPKEATASEVADALDVATPTFTEHLAAAQHNLLAELLDTEQSQLPRSGV
ncbi:helix-turn-helix domain-containing protein [Halapricum desulfuricans]|uniref:Transcriptional regulator, contains HTH domain n=1 Tax=Halapricum desulfuricans TaxID=2841257 RepID=A0A897NVP2_9EURY|nr:helix-turn-helix domain-containing protein [Halapricum desulfuricans]QSG14769.1 Transcriptional regulator, contains HTH domain [Halapricum desulfuricans]